MTRYFSDMAFGDITPLSNKFDLVAGGLCVMGVFDRYTGKGYPVEYSTKGLNYLNWFNNRMGSFFHM